MGQRSSLRTVRKKLVDLFFDWFLRPALRTQTLFIGWVVMGLCYYVGFEGRSVEDTFYVLAQIITTVGYGDITVGDDTSRWVSAAYVLVAVLVLSSLVSEYSDSLVQSQSKVVKTGIEKLLHSVAQEDSDSADLSPAKSKSSRLVGEVVNWYLDNHELRAFVRSVIVWDFMILVGCVFFCNYPGEDKTVAEAFYMSVITLTTVGFGDLTPKTPIGKVFATVWMLVGCAAFVDMAANFSKLTLSVSFSRKELTSDSLRQMFDSTHIKTSQEDRSRKFYQLMEERLKSHTGIDEQIRAELLSMGSVNASVGRSDFILHCLLEMGVVGQDLVQKISSDFDVMDRDGSGYLDEQDLRTEEVKREVRRELHQRRVSLQGGTPGTEPLLGLESRPNQP